MKLGIYGGTYNPVHKGHLHFAATAADRLGLDRVLLMVSDVPPHKSNEQVVEARHRLNMCRLAAREDPRFEACDLELKRGGVSYTVDTLRQLRALYPEDELYLLTGTDMFCSILDWRCPHEVLTLAQLVGAPRMPDDLPLLEQKKQVLASRGYTSIVLDLMPVPVSSTDIREHGAPELPTQVEQYILQNGLYGQTQHLGYDLDALTALLRQRLSRKRFDHSLAVANEAIRLAERYGENAELCYIAGLLHDICKEIDKPTMLKMIEDSGIITDTAFLSAPKIWHGFAAAIELFDELSVYNTQILDAVRYHSVGRGGMTLLERIIYMADMIGADRSFEGVEALRAKTNQSLEEGMLESLSFIMGQVLLKGQPLVTDTVSAYNELACLLGGQRGER